MRGEYQIVGGDGEWFPIKSVRHLPLNAKNFRLRRTNMKKEEPVKDIVADMNYMHNHYGIHNACTKLTKEQWKTFLKFRLDFLQEELNEAYAAYECGDAEEIVDALVDLVVIAVGTADLFGVDFHKAWKEVLKANLNKSVGIKPSRPNPLGLPDLIKNDGWLPPSHEGNHGKIASECFSH